MQSTCLFGSVYTTCWVKTVWNPAGEEVNLHWYCLEYDHLCYNLLIPVNGFAWCRMIYNVMDYYFIIHAKGKKLQIFTIFTAFQTFFPLIWKHNTGEAVSVCTQNIVSTCRSWALFHQDFQACITSFSTCHHSFLWSQRLSLFKSKERVLIAITRETNETFFSMLLLNSYDFTLCNQSENNIERKHFKFNIK